jgi:hypothetical protein
VLIAGERKGSPDLPLRERPLECLMDAHGPEWVSVFAYFDETGVHGEVAPITAVAGYLFPKRELRIFRRAFDRNVYPLLPLDEHGDKMYRSALCIPGKGYFASLSEAEREKIVDLLVDAIKKSVTLGVMIAIRREDYAQAIAASPQIGKLAGGKYSVCLIRCIENMVAWLDQRRIPGRICYVFEAGCAYANEADAILKKIPASRELKKRYRWHSYAFFDKSFEVPQLFAPDLLAWEWQRAYINATDPRYSEWGPTLKTLVDGTPHLQAFETATSVGIRAMINAFCGLTLPGGTDDGQA